ncbi:MAG: hypothetical protein J1D89_05425 [Agathobacter sp.]|nr:hypothetical protein [Agathobacter sp.]
MDEKRSSVHWFGFVDTLSVYENRDFGQRVVFAWILVGSSAVASRWETDNLCGGDAGVWDWICSVFNQRVVGIIIFLGNKG